MKYFVVSDVHGFYTQLMNALTKEGFDEENPEHKLIVCGDLMDRGKEAFELQEYILKLLKNDKVILIRGNHEDLVLEMINNFDDYARDIMYTHHAHNRTIHTMLDLTGMDLSVAMFEPDDFKAACKRTRFIKDIIPKMVDFFETEHYIFVHGWIPDSYRGYTKSWRTANPKAWERARWTNGIDSAMYYKCTEPGKTIVCGHWHCSYGHEVYEKGSPDDYSPFYGEGIIAIDACTALSGKVNCIVIED